MRNSVWTEFGIEHAKKGEGRSTVALKDRRGPKTAPYNRASRFAYSLMSFFGSRARSQRIWPR